MSDKYQEDYAVSVIPRDKRRSLLSLTLVWTATVITVSGLVVGSFLVAGMSLQGAFTAVILGNILLTVIGGIIGTMGARQGVGSAMLARHTFGRQGAKIIAICVAIVMLGWFSFQIDVFGKTLNAMFPNGGFIFSPQVAAIWGGVLMTLTAYMGYRGLSMLSTVAVPVLVVLALVGVMTVIGKDGGFGVIASYVPEGTMAMAVAIDIVAGAVIAGACVQADIMRYAKSDKDVWISTAIGFMIANAFMMMVGYMLSVSSGTWDLPAAMVGLGLGIPALLVLVLAQWTTNDSNLYWSSLSFANIVNVEKRKIVLVCGALGILATLLGIADNFVSFLLVLGKTIPPIAGIFVADYFFVSKGQYIYGKGTKYSQWQVSALIAWVVAIVVGFKVTWGVSVINALVVSFVVYFVLAKVLNQKISVGEYEEQDNGF